METRQINTQFMRANKTDEVFDMLVDEHGMGIMCNHEIDYNEALFSNGFIYACENGMTPILGSHQDTFENKGDEEYHHMIFDGVCYNVFFKEIN